MHCQAFQCCIIQFDLLASVSQTFCSAQCTAPCISSESASQLGSQSVQARYTWTARADNANAVNQSLTETEHATKTKNSWRPTNTHARWRSAEAGADGHTDRQTDGQQAWFKRRKRRRRLVLTSTGGHSSIRTTNWRDYLPAYAQYRRLRNPVPHLIALQTRQHDRYVALTAPYRSVPKSHSQTRRLIVADCNATSNRTARSAAGPGRTGD